MSGRLGSVAQDSQLLNAWAEAVNEWFDGERNQEGRTPLFVLNLRPALYTRCMRGAGPLALLA